jgi:hypothetical protein
LRTRFHLFAHRTANVAAFEPWEATFSLESLPRFEVGWRCRCDGSRIPPGQDVLSGGSRAEPAGSSRQC